MNFYPTKFPYIFRRLFSSLIYKMPNNDKTIYLTFDDGPTPKITEWVLSELEKVQAKATFFCVGDKIPKYPEIITRILLQNHMVANHSYHHIKGWKTTSEQYLDEVVETEKLLNAFFKSKKLFRPPYGRITPKQIKLLHQLDYKIIMWTIVVGDFSKSINTQKAIKYLTDKTSSGDILVFHDSQKAYPQLQKILPKTLENLKKRGFKFEVL